MRVQAELDETKVVLHKTIESLLERGDKLDSLVQRSDALSTQSKMFYKTARKQVTSSMINPLKIEPLLYCHVVTLQYSKI
jgi:synaptobrevin homolog YKT6